MPSPHRKQIYPLSSARWKERGHSLSRFLLNSYSDESTKISAAARKRNNGLNFNRGFYSFYSDHWLIIHYIDCLFIKKLATQNIVPLIFVSEELKYFSIVISVFKCLKVTLYLFHFFTVRRLCCRTIQFINKHNL